MPYTLTSLPWPILYVTRGLLPLTNRVPERTRYIAAIDRASGALEADTQAFLAVCQNQTLVDCGLVVV